MISENAATPAICIVDDEEAIRRAMERTLLMAGFHDVITCAGWRDARRYLETRSVQLVLLDITMPGVSGEDALVECRERWPGVPVVMVTGVHDLSTAVRCMKRGAADYLPKPVSREALITAVQAVLALHAPQAAEAAGEAVNNEVAEADPAAAHPRRPVDILQQARQHIRPYLPDTLSLAHVPHNHAADRDDLEIAERLVRYLGPQGAYRDGPLTQNRAAIVLGTNVSYLSRAVNSVFGISFRSLVNRLRIAAALVLVEEGELARTTMESIASDVGFGGRSTFYRALRRELSLLMVDDGGGDAVEMTERD